MTTTLSTPEPIALVQLSSHPMLKKGYGTIIVKHATFLMYKFSRYFICTLAKTIISKFSTIISLIMFGRSITLGSYFLALLYQISFQHDNQKMNLGQNVSSVRGGPLWVLQLWIVLMKFNSFKVTLV